MLAERIPLLLLVYLSYRNLTRCTRSLENADLSPWVFEISKPGICQHPAVSNLVDVLGDSVSWRLRAEMASTDSQDYVSLDKAREILYNAKTAYPAVVLGVFLLGFIIYGVVNAPSEDGKVEVHAKRGPGGRPLPLRRKSARQVKDAIKVTDFSPNSKLIFKAISAGILVSFVANGAAIILQVLIYRDDRWWPGQSAVVSPEHENNESPADS